MYNGNVMESTRHSRNAPGLANRKGLTIFELLRMFPDDDAGEKWLIQQRWPDGIRCPNCDADAITENRNRRSPFRCRKCRKDFSTKTASLMQSSNLGYRAWAVAIYMAVTNLKGVSSMKLHRELGITQKSAWHLMHRIRENWEDRSESFAGPVEVDETYVGGRRKNMSNAKREALADTGRGPVGKTAVVGAKDRATKQVAAKVVTSTDADTLQGFVKEKAVPDATVYTDDATAYNSLPFDHDTVKHSLSEYVNGDIHTNGIESLWSMLKRAHKGTFHKLSPKHLDRYVQEFAGRHNLRELDTLEQMGAVARGTQGKRLRYKDLIADNGLSSGARAA